jgi:hypothetical protein
MINGHSPEYWLSAIAELTEFAEEDAGNRRAAKRRGYGEPRGGHKRGVYFTKTTSADSHDDDGVSPHAEVQTEHHAKMARLYEAIASRHASMADHYGAGAKGAHVAGEDDVDHEFTEAETDEPSEGDIELLKRRAASGDVAARLELAALSKRAVSACLTHPRIGFPR